MISDDINVNEVVKSGKAKTLTQTECELLIEQLKDKGMVVKRSVISSRSLDPYTIRTYYRIKEQKSKELRTHIAGLLTQAELCIYIDSVIDHFEQAKL